MSLHPCAAVSRFLSAASPACVNQRWPVPTAARPVPVGQTQLAESAALNLRALLTLARPPPRLAAGRRNAALEKNLTSREFTLSRVFCGGHGTPGTLKRELPQGRHGEFSRNHALQQAAEDELPTFTYHGDML